MQRPVRLKNMLIGERRVVQSRSNANLLAAAEDFVSIHPEILVIVPSHSAGEELAQRRNGAAGVHRLTLVQLASDLSRPAMAAMGLAPMTQLGLEALSARVVHAALKQGELDYFRPVASLPGFARALARTIAELRMARVECAKLSETGAAGRDLASCCNATTMSSKPESSPMRRACSSWRRCATESKHRWLGLPLLLLDVQLDFPAQRDFFESVASRAPSVLVCELHDGAGTDPAPDFRTGTFESLSVFSRAARGQSRWRAGNVFRARRRTGSSGDRAAHREARASGKPFDRIAILLRSPERYQPMIEEALAPREHSGLLQPRHGASRSRWTRVSGAARVRRREMFGVAIRRISIAGSGSACGFSVHRKWVPADDEILTAIRRLRNRRKLKLTNPRPCVRPPRGRSCWWTRR